MLAPLLRDAGWAPTCLHAALDYPDPSVDTLFMASYGAHLFGALLVAPAERAGLIDPLVARFTADLNLHGLIIPGATLADLERDEGAMRTWVVKAIADAEACVDACCRRIVALRPAAVLMSATFEGQIVAAIALTRRLRALGVTAPVALGGAACFDAAASALITHYPELSAVCVGEGEPVVVPLVEALTGHRALAEVPGIVWRAAPSPDAAPRPTRDDSHTPAPTLARTNPRPPAVRLDDSHTPAPTLTRTNPRPPAVRLDHSPIPDYRDYFADWAASPWRHVPPRLFVELSRGCWWGAKHLCTFCGLNADSLDFRSKSPARAITELTELHHHYPAATRLAATDNILAMRYLDTVLPALEGLASADRPLRVFFEVKSNLRKDQLAALRRAGIHHVQPGIESFDDQVLTLMKKGNTALGQVQFIKWCAELGIQPSYNLIVMNPGEETAAYHRMLPLIEAIDHLPSPDNVTPVWLERFAPYHQTPARWGIERVRPRPYYAAIYPDLATRAPEALADLAYVFDFDCESLSSSEHHEAVRRFALRVGRWQWEWETLTAWHHDDGLIELVDTRPGREVRQHLDSDASALYRWLDEVRPAATLTAERFGPRVAEHLETWRARGHVIRDTRDRWLATLPRRA